MVFELLLAEYNKVLGLQSQSLMYILWYHMALW